MRDSPTLMRVGQMLLSWLLSSFNQEHVISQRVSRCDLRLIAVQFCTQLLAANVIRKLENESATPSNIFKVTQLTVST